MKRQMKLLLVLLTVGMSQAALGKFNLTTKAGLKSAFDKAMVVSKQGPAQRRQFRVSMGGANQNPATNFANAIDAVFAKAQGASGAAAVAKQRNAVKKAVTKAKSDAATLAVSVAARAKETIDTLNQEKGQLRKNLNKAVKDGTPDVTGLKAKVAEFQAEPNNAGELMKSLQLNGIIRGIEKSPKGLAAIDALGINPDDISHLLHIKYISDTSKIVNTFYPQAKALLAKANADNKTLVADHNRVLGVHQKLLLQRKARIEDLTTQVADFTVQVAHQKQALATEQAATATANASLNKVLAAASALKDEIVKPAYIQGKNNKAVVDSIVASLEAVIEAAN